MTNNNQHEKMTVKTVRTSEVTLLRCAFYVLDWEDGTFDGQTEDYDNPQMPCIVEDQDSGNRYWSIDVDPDTGKILNWPEGHTASIEYRVKDGCFIVFSTPDGEFTYEGYVPRFFDTYGDGYGDYLHFDILADGTIEDWGDRGLMWDLTPED